MMPSRLQGFVLAGAAGALLFASACTLTSTTPAKSTSPTAVAAGIQEITVTAQDITFPQKHLTLNAGVPARLVIVNQGTIEHDITIPGLAVGAAADAHGHEEASHSMGALPPGTVHATAKPGDRAAVEFTPKAGTYTFTCSIAGHKEAGMQGTLVVQ